MHITFAQESTDSKIANIHIKGNENLKKEVILQELTFKKGDNVPDKEEIEYNRKLLLKTGLYKDVKISVKTNEATELKDIEIILKPISYTLYPIPEIQLMRPSYLGASLMDSSIFGNRDRYNIGVYYYPNWRKPAWDVRYTKPNYNKDYFWDIHLYRTFNGWRLIDSGDVYNYNFCQDNMGISLTIGKKLFKYGSAYFKYNEIYQEEFLETRNPLNNQIYITTIDNLNDRSSELIFLYNSTDNNYFPLNGVRMFLIYKFSMFFSDRRYNIVNFNYSQYFLIIKNVVFALNLKNDFLFSSYNHIAFSDIRYRDNILIYSSEHILSSLRIETRISLLWNFALVLFLDGGEQYKDINSIDLKKYQFWYGFGLRFSPKAILPGYLGTPIGIYFSFTSETQNFGDSWVTIQSHRDNLFYVDLTAEF